MQDGGIDKPDAGESTSGTRTDPSEEVDFEGLSTLDEPVAETIVSAFLGDQDRTVFSNF